VAIAGIATGGLPIPLLIGLATASWAITKSIEEIGQNQKRASRNWLKRLPSALSGANASHGAFLTVEAGDALRRAVDHYRMMSAIGKEVKAAEAPTSSPVRKCLTTSRRWPALSITATRCATTRCRRSPC
jgi:hypothetical protein